MATVTKTFVFASDAEGLSDGGNSASATFSYDGTDGSPDNGCVKFVATGSASEYGRRASTGQTWETWGVPASSIVTQVQITAIQAKTPTFAPSSTTKIRIVDSGGANVCSADLYSDTSAAAPMWVALNPQSARSVFSDRRVSTTDVRLEIEQYSGGAGTFLYDTIELTITYAASDSGGGSDDGSGGGQVGGGGTAVGAVDGLIFNKGYMYLTRHGGTADAVAFGALQNVYLSHEYTTVELAGPEAVPALAAGINEESLIGTFDCGVIHPEQLTAVLGGSMALSGTDTLYTKLVTQDPLPFDLHFESDIPGEDDLDLLLFNCVMPEWSIRAENRAFMIEASSFEVYGQSPADGGRLFILTMPGNLTNSS